MIDSRIRTRERFLAFRSLGDTIFMTALSMLAPSYDKENVIPDEDVRSLVHQA